MKSLCCLFNYKSYNSRRIFRCAYYVTTFLILLIARWEWRAMCAHSRALFSLIFYCALLLNPASKVFSFRFPLAFLGIVAHLSPIYKLHLDLMSWNIFFLLTFLGSKLTTMVYRLFLCKDWWGISWVID